MAAQSAVVPFDGTRGDVEHLAIVPVPAPSPTAGFDERNDIVLPPKKAWIGHAVDEREKRRKRVESGLLVVLGVLDNAMCYATYWTVSAFHGRLYNIVDLQLTLLPGINAALLVFALLGTGCFVALIGFVECMQWPVFHETMNVRLICTTLPCAAICTMLIFISEQTQVAPLLALASISFSAFLWCLHMRLRYAHELNIFSKVALDASWFLTLLFLLIVTVLYATNSLKYVTNSEELNCPYARNVRMPVYAVPLGKWFCAPWDATKDAEISRLPLAATATPLTCKDGFMDIFGSSLEPHKVICPSGCLRTFSSGGIFGCGVYTVDSPICPAAVHAGVLTDSGGQATVYGRVGVPVFTRCSGNSLVSSERVVARSGESLTVQPPGKGGSSPFVAGRRLAAAAPLLYTKDGRKFPQAYHFNSVNHTREFIRLSSYELVPSNDGDVKDGEPWSRVDAVVSMRLAGLELEFEKVRLGQILRPVDKSGRVNPSACIIRDTGVLCRGSSAELVQLDFCRPDVKTCLRDELDETDR